VVDLPAEISEWNEDKELPQQAYTLYGCNSCEWKGSVACPYNIKKWDVRPIANNICPARIDYLKNFMRSKRYKSFERFQLDINKGLMNQESMDSYMSLQMLKREYDKIKDTLDEELNLKWINEINVARNDWFKAIGMVNKFEDKQVERDTPKKTEVNIRKTLTPSDLNRVLNMNDDEIVDAEYDLIDED